MHIDLVRTKFVSEQERSMKRERQRAAGSDQIKILNRSHFAIWWLLAEIDSSYATLLVIWVTNHWACHEWTRFLWSRWPYLYKRHPASQSVSLRFWRLSWIEGGKGEEEEEDRDPCFRGFRHSVNQLATTRNIKITKGKKPEANWGRLKFIALFRLLVVPRRLLYNFATNMAARSQRACQRDQVSRRRKPFWNRLSLSLSCPLSWL